MSTDFADYADFLSAFFGQGYKVDQEITTDREVRFAQITTVLKKIRVNHLKICEISVYI